MMSFKSGSDQLFFEGVADYPYSRPLEKMQAIDRTASGKTEVEVLGPQIVSRNLVFTDMSKQDFLDISNWFDVIADGAVNPFEFTDEEGYIGNVIITTTMNSFRETSFELYSGKMSLEYV